MIPLKKWCCFALARRLHFCARILKTKPIYGGNMKAFARKIMLLALAVTVVTTASGCNENDVAKGVIVGGIIGGIIGGGGGTVITNPGYGGYN